MQKKLIKKNRTSVKAHQQPYSNGLEFNQSAMTNTFGYALKKCVYGEKKVFSTTLPHLPEGKEHLKGLPFDLWVKWLIQGIKNSVEAKILLRSTSHVCARYLS